MSVNAKELAALQNMWNGAKPQTDCSLPDGFYEFVITDAQFKVTSNGIPQIVTVLKVVGGNETFIGETVPQRDSLQTPENMGWFKKKLARLGITIPENVEELTNRIPKELKGKKFAGQLKSKDEFVNVYVNKFLGDTEVDGAAEEETTEEETSESSDINVGDQVMFVSAKGADVQGELLELTEDGKARVKTAEGKVFKVDASKVTLAEVTEAAAEESEEEETVEETEEETEEATEEEATEDAGGFPTPEEVKAMKLPELKQILADNDMDIAKIKNPRMFVTGLSSFMYVEKYMPDLPTLLALRDGFGMAIVKNEKPAEMTKRVVKELKSRFDF